MLGRAGFGLPVFEAPLVDGPVGFVLEGVAPLVVTPGFFAGVVTGVRFLVVVVDLLDGDLLVGREVLPPIIPPPVAPPSCCPTAKLAEASKKTVMKRSLNRVGRVKTSLNRGGRAVVDMNSLPVLEQLAFRLKQGPKRRTDYNAGAIRLGTRFV